MKKPPLKKCLQVCTYYDFHINPEAYKTIRQCWSNTYLILDASDPATKRPKVAYFSHNPEGDPVPLVYSPSRAKNPSINIDKSAEIPGNKETDEQIIQHVGESPKKDDQEIAGSAVRDEPIETKSVDHPEPEPSPAKLSSNETGSC